MADINFNWQQPVDGRSIGNGQDMANWMAQQNGYNDINAYQQAQAQQAQIQAQQQQALQQQQDAIRAKIAQNNATIASLKARLAQISDDDMDRRLAANRASVGDIGNALNHLNRIDNRDSKRIELERQKRLDIEDIQKKLRINDNARSYGGLTQKELDNLDAEDAYLKSKLKAYGAEYIPGEATGTSNVSTTDFKSFIANNTDKLGHFTGATEEEAVANRAKAAQMVLEAGGENASEEAIKILRTKTAPQHKKDVDASYAAGAKAYAHLNSAQKALADKKGEFTADGISYKRNSKTGKWYK